MVRKLEMSWMFYASWSMEAWSFHLRVTDCWQGNAETWGLVVCGGWISAGFQPSSHVPSGSTRRVRSRWLCILFLINALNLTSG
jgi:hypothetical protein